MQSMVDQASMYCAIAIGLIGLGVNVSLLVLILQRKALYGKDFIIFILNRTLIDVAYCMHLVILQPLGFMHASDSVWCKAAGFFYVLLMLSSMLAEPLVAFNRYVSLQHRNRYAKIFKKPNVILMCVTVWILGSCGSIPHIFSGALGRTQGNMCSISLTKETLVATVCADYILVTMNYMLIVFFYQRIFRKVHAHQKRRTMTDAQRSRLQEDSDMLTFIALAAAVPIVLEVPTVVCSMWRLVDVNAVSDLMLFVTTVFINVTVVINPLVAVFMVKPIRKEAEEVLKRLKCSSKTQVVPIPVTINVTVTTSSRI